MALEFQTFTFTQHYMLLHIHYIYITDTLPIHCIYIAYTLRKHCINITIDIGYALLNHTFTMGRLCIINANH